MSAPETTAPDWRDETLPPAARFEAFLASQPSRDEWENAWPGIVNAHIKAAVKDFDPDRFYAEFVKLCATRSQDDCHTTTVYNLSTGRSTEATHDHQYESRIVFDASDGMSATWGLLAPAVQFAVRAAESVTIVDRDHAAWAFDARPYDEGFTCCNGFRLVLVIPPRRLDRRVYDAMHFVAHVVTLVAWEEKDHGAFVDVCGAASTNVMPIQKMIEGMAGNVPPGAGRIEPIRQGRAVRISGTLTRPDFSLTGETKAGAPHEYPLKTIAMFLADADRIEVEESPGPMYPHSNQLIIDTKRRREWEEVAAVCRAMPKGANCEKAIARYFSKGGGHA